MTKKVAKTQIDGAYAEDVEKAQVLDTVAERMAEEQLQLSEKVGALKAFDFTQKLLTVSTIKMLAEIKESKQYKGLQVFDADGKLLTVSNWANFCQSLGKSHQHIDEEIRNLATFGEDFLETSQRMGIGYRDLRKLRALPEEDRALVVNGEIELAVGDKEAIVDLIDSLSAKHAKEKTALEKQVEEAKAENKATSRIISDKNKKISELESQIIKQETKTLDDKTKEQIEALDNAMVQCLFPLPGLEDAIGKLLENGEENQLMCANALHELKDKVEQLQIKFSLGHVAPIDDSWMDDVPEVTGGTPLL